jgi:hypothetical protein
MAPSLLHPFFFFLFAFGPVEVETRANGREPSSALIGSTISPVHLRSRLYTKAIIDGSIPEPAQGSPQLSARTTHRK